jgi:hypothetical protein
MIDTTHKLVPAPADSLHAELRALIASSRQRLAGAVNAELTRLYWNVGQRLRRMVQFAVAFPDTEKVALLMRHLSWSHFVNLLLLKTGGAAANAQRRHHRGRVLDRTATQSGAGAKAACRFA